MLKYVLHERIFISKKQACMNLPGKNLEIATKSICALSLKKKTELNAQFF